MSRAAIRRASLGLAVLIQFACSGFPLNVEEIPVSADPAQEIGRLHQRVERAREADVAVLSPGWFAKAEMSLSGAERTREQGGSVQGILNDVARGIAEIDQAEAFARISRATVPQAIEARRGARAAGAPKLGEVYTLAEQAFLELTRDIENDDTSAAQNRQPGVVKQFRDVELQAIKENTLREVRALIRQARADGALRLVPQTLAATEAELQSVEQFITQNRYAQDEANERASVALFQAQRLQQLTAEAKQVSASSPEQICLAQERTLDRAREALGLADQRNRSFDTQREALVQGVTELLNDRNFLVNRNELLRSELEQRSIRIASLEGGSAEERERIARLEAERQFNQLYSEVSAFFTPEEATVYRQGQQLVIRLRQIQFPVGEYVLQPESYSLLAKVQRAIRAFGDPNVVIEGHTDTTGSAELNDHLSQLRANAVRDYLVANRTVPEANITAVGFGFSEPLATNRTAEGRAQNRRIDVVIDAPYRGTGELVDVASRAIDGENQSD